MRRRIVLHLLLVAVLLSLLVAVFPSNASAVGTTGAIVGHVERAGLRGDVAVDNATVQLSNGMSTVTDSNGRFEFDNLTAGNYSLTVINNGRTALTEDVSVVAGQTVDLGVLRIGGGILGLVFIVLIPLAIIIVVVVVVVYLLLRRRKRKRNELLNRQQQEQQGMDPRRQ